MCSTVGLLKKRSYLTHMTNWRCKTDWRGPFEQDITVSLIFTIHAFLQKHPIPEDWKYKVGQSLEIVFHLRDYRFNPHFALLEIYLTGVSFYI